MQQSFCCHINKSMVWWCLRAPYSKMPLLLSSNIIKWTVETGALQLFIKASQNFREIHYHFSVPTSRQLIQASRGAYTTLNNLCYCGPLLQDYGRAGPKLAAGRDGPGRKMAWKLQAGPKIFGPCTSLVQISSPEGALLMRDDVRIFPHAAKHRSQWSWCWDFPACCQLAVEAVECHIKFSKWNIRLAMEPLVKIRWPLVIFVLLMLPVVRRTF